MVADSWIRTHDPFDHLDDLGLGKRAIYVLLLAPKYDGFSVLTPSSAEQSISHYKPQIRTAQCSKGMKLKNLDFLILMLQNKVLVVPDCLVLKV